jgi:molybdopterin converting factor small subunit
MDVKVKIKLTGLLAASAGFREKTVELPNDFTISEAIVFINLPVSGTWTKSSVNGHLREKSYVLREGDELLLFPIGGGG